MYEVNLSKEAFENSGGYSKAKMNREYLLRKSVAADFNTYLGFDPFYVFGDTLTGEQRAGMYDSEGKLKKDIDPKTGRLGVRSIFNRSGGMYLGSGSTSPFVMSEWRASNNVPLIDTPENRMTLRKNSGYTIKELVDASETGILGSALYSYADFMYCKYLGQMPNNYLVTLRRFPTPVDDYISSAMLGKNRLDIKSSNPIPIGTMVTWLNTPGNEIEEILNYQVTMPYDEKSANASNMGSSGADDSNKPLNAAAAMFDKKYRQQYQQGMSGHAIQKYMEKILGPETDAPYSGFLNFQDSNKVYGPVDAVKKVYYRGDQGINFQHSFKLTFDYELRSYNGINGRQAMLDLISNILNVTYSTGTFWGGSYTGGGAHQNNLFSNLNIFKANGGFTSFVDAFAQDMSTIKGEVQNTVKANGGVLNTIKNFLNDLGGMLIGGFLNKLGRPQKSAVNALLSPAPTGLWHVTIGNPFHPIMSMGNMVLKSTTITHLGPLGLDDFPTGLRVVCELDRGKPRDLRGIEMLYMNGNDRIYSSMGPHIFTMYTHAKIYKDSGGANTSDGNGDPVGIASFYNDYKDSNKISKNNIDEINKKVQNNDAMKATLMKYFGTTDTFSIYIQAAEQEFGAWKKKK